ncbi:MAG: hypothetical protein J6P84_05385 [Alphaproteobacteria bacterium]|nr:hypothetical protein [Alphaproteobacteria bacterium]
MEEEVIIPIKIVKRGSAKVKVLSESEDKKINKYLCRALAKAYKWEHDLMNSSEPELYISRNKLSRRYMMRILKLNNLSPKIKKAIMNGSFPQDVFLQDLITKKLSLSWREQERLLLERGK